MSTVSEGNAQASGQASGASSGWRASQNDTPHARDPRQYAYLPQPVPHLQPSPQQQLDSWRFNASADDSVGVGAYFGRLEGQSDSVARVKSLVPGGPAEQTGIIEVGDALCAVDDVDVYGQPLCELGKRGTCDE